MIELRNVFLSFGEEKPNALSDVSISIPEGSAYGLLGSNGAGKSTILRVLAGIYKPDAGIAEIDGQTIYDNSRVKERVFLVGDETAQFNGMTINEMCAYYKAFYHSFDEALFNKLINTVKLPLNRKLMRFSKGMKRQAAVICGIACKTPYLLLDEAFDGLDPTMRNIVKQMLIDAMLDSGLTVIFSSHNLREMDEFCDRVGLLHDGKVVFDRELDCVKGDIVKIQAAFDREVTEKDFPGARVLHIGKSGSVTTVITRGDREQIHAAAQALSPKFCDELPLDLEEIFIYEMEAQGYDSSKLTD